MDAPAPRFQCPPGFEAVTPTVALARGGPDTELWLIRAPADFCPQSLEGLPVPLQGLEQLWTGGDNGDNGDNDSDNDTKLYVLRGGAGGGDCPLLLSPVSPEGSLRCAPPLGGSLTIARSFGTPPPAGRKRRKAKVTTELVAPGDTGTAEGTVPPVGTTEGTVPPAGEGPGPPQVAPEEPEVAKRRKKKKKHKREEQQ